MAFTGIKFSQDHEWIKEDNGKVYIGISDFAQHSLGDIVFVDLPVAGFALKKGDVLAGVESVKAVSDVFAPVACTVVAANEELNDSPELLNSSPYEAWIAVIQLADEADVSGLMDEAAYADFCAQQG